MAWHAKETVRGIYDLTDPIVARDFAAQLGLDLQDESRPVEMHSLGRTLRRWLDHITAWHEVKVTNGPTETINNLIKRIKRIGFGFHRLRHYRIHALLYAGRPNWTLLATVTPR
jgi:transposase